MQGLSYRKYCAAAIVVLFIGISIAPSISGSIGELNSASLIEEVSDISSKLKKTNGNDMASYDESAVFGTRLFDAGNSFGGTIYVDGDNTEGPWDGTQEHPYQHIQDAIDNAIDGDTVYVYGGTYYENVIVDKSLNLMGEDMTRTIIDGGKMTSENEKNMIHIIADRVNISGFTIQNTTYLLESSADRYGGINISSDNNNVSRNIIKSIEERIYDDHFYRRQFGIYMYNSDNNIISDNIIKSIDGDGIKLWYADNNFISGNKISHCTSNGFDGYKSENNTIYGNIVNSTLFHYGGGMYFKYFVNNNISNNIVSNSVRHGISLCYNCSNNFISYNYIHSIDSGEGIRVFNSQFTNDHSYNNIFLGNNITNNGAEGLRLTYSDYTIVSGNNISSNGGYGIFVYGGNNYTIYENTVDFNNDDGINLVDSNRNKIYDNKVSNNNGNGIKLSYECTYNIIFDNQINSNKNHGIYLDDNSNYKSYNNQIIGNTVNSNYMNGIYLRKIYDSILSCNYINSNKEQGISIYDSKGQTISNNTVIFNNENGIRIENSDILKIFENNITNNNNIGIVLTKSCDYNTISFNNIILNNKAGIHLKDSTENTISNNNITDSKTAIELKDYSNHNLINNNQFKNCGFFINKSNYNYIEDNTINDKPLVYLTNESDKTISNAGQIILINCNNINVENLNLSYATMGPYLWKTNNSKIINNDCSNNEYGIYILNSNFNNISDNTISSTDKYSFEIKDSSNNIVRGNTIPHGIDIDNILNTVITDNVIDYEGIKFKGSKSSNWNTHIIENNTVKGKTIYYYSNTVNIVVPRNAAQVIIANCSYSYIQNLNILDVNQGIQIGYSSNNNITGNTISENNLNGIYVFNSTNNVIHKNEIYNNSNGIKLVDSSYNEILRNNISNNRGNGIYLHYSSDNTITGNLISYNNNNGIYAHRSPNSIINKNNVNNNKNTELRLREAGIHLHSSPNSIISGNNVFKNDEFGIFLHGISNSIITGNRVSNYNFNDGLVLYNSDDNNLSGNNVSFNDVGVYMYASYRNSISMNNITNNEIGLHFRHSFNNTIKENNFFTNFISHASFYYEKVIWYLINSMRHNRWRGNYWGKPSYLPRPVIGGIFIKQFDHPHHSFPIIVPWYECDWFPAKEPYDIPIPEVP